MYIIPFLIFGLFLPLLSFGASHPLTKEKLVSSAGQFSGAIQWAHKQGVRGEDETAIVLEEDYPPEKLRDTLGDLLRLFPTDPKEWKRSNLRPINHSHLVVDTLHQIAPRSKIALLELSSTLPIPSFQEKFKDDLKITTWIKDALIINASYLTISTTNLKQYIAGALQKALLLNKKRLHFLWSQGQPKIVFQGAGNEGLSLSVALLAKDNQKIESDSLVLLSDKTFGNYVLIIGGLSQQSGPYPDTNYPGENLLIQNNFLCTLGEDIKIEDKYWQGTSLSTPIASGAALLLKEAYPSLSALEIKEILLESASKNFFISNPIESRAAINGIFVYDKEDGPPNPEKLKNPYTKDVWKRSYKPDIQEFTPQRYGKGILDLRAAFIYAHLKVQHPNWNKEKLRAGMKKKMKEEESAAATIIQSIFRDHKEREKLKHSQQTKPQIPPLLWQPKENPVSASPTSHSPQSNRALSKNKGRKLVVRPHRKTSLKRPLFRPLVRHSATDRALAGPVPIEVKN